MTVAHQHFDSVKAVLPDKTLNFIGAVISHHKINASHGKQRE